MTKTLILLLTLFSLLFINMGEVISIEINSPEIIVVEDSSEASEDNIKEDDRLRPGEPGKHHTNSEEDTDDGTEEDDPPH